MSVPIEGIGVARWLTSAGAYPGYVCITAKSRVQRFSLGISKGEGELTVLMLFNDEKICLPGLASYCVLAFWNRVLYYIWHLKRREILYCLRDEKVLN